MISSNCSNFHLINILAVLNNVVLWMVSIHSPSSKSSGPFNNPLVTVPKAPIPIGIIITIMFNSFFNSLAKSMYLSFFFTFFQFYSVVSQDSKVHNFASFIYFIFLLIIITSGLLAEIR